jgi:hypothetical protein
MCSSPGGRLLAFPLVPEKPTNVLAFVQLLAGISKGSFQMPIQIRVATSCVDNNG